MGSTQQEQPHDDSAIALLDEGLDAKFAATIHQTLTSNLTHVHTGIS